MRPPLSMIPPEVREALKALEALPALGDPGKLYPVSLTEPEINAIGAAVGFMREACKGFPILKPFWQHYGDTLETLSERLALIED